MSFSKINCMAKLLKDSEVKQTSDGRDIVNLYVTTGNQVTMSCACFGELASSLGNKLQKGNIVYISGTLGIYTAPPKDGEQYGKKSYQVNVSDIYRLSETPETLAFINRNSSDTPAASPAQVNNSNNVSNASEVFEDIEDDDIPF